MELTDSHCHLSFKDYSDDLPQVLARAREAGVSTMVTIGAGEGFEGNQEALGLARAHPHIWATVGIHPHDAKIVTPEIVTSIEAMAADPKVVAIGEIGLDFHYVHSPGDVQEGVFRQFIELAQSLGKPIVIHDRDAGERTYDILREMGAREVVIHCFTGTWALAEKYLNLGYFLSVSGIITFKNAGALREVVRMAPMDRLLVETDAPFLAPVPYRGKRNEPAHVALVVSQVAQEKGMDLVEVARQTTANARKLFRLQ